MYGRLIINGFSIKKRQIFFILFVAILIIGGVTLIPLLLDDESTINDLALLLVVFLLSSGILLWSSFSIRYTFYQDHLFVKGGPFRSKIPYDEITKIAPTKEILTGYRLLSSKDSYEIFYQSGILGSVKISPKESDRFISELKKRCPTIEIQN